MNIKHRFLAYIELMSKYMATIRYFWKHRSSYRGTTLTENEAEFLPAALSLQERPISPTASWTGRSLMCIVIFSLLWSVLGHLDIVVNAQGKVIPSSRVKTIGSVDVASIRAIHVSDGQRVRAGELLIELDTGVNDAERDKAIGDQREGVLQIARARALLEAIDHARPPSLPARVKLAAAYSVDIAPSAWDEEQSHVTGAYQDYLAKLRRIDDDIAHLESVVPLVSERARDYHELMVNDDVPHHAWLEKEQARLDAEGQLADARNQRTALRAETKRIAFDQLTEGNRMAASAREDALRSSAHGRLLSLTSPVDGTVQQLAVHTIGGVVAAAQPLMQIVPTAGALEVEAFLENKDIGFVQEGQTSQVKIDAFDYSRYGTIPAVVTLVSRDAIQDEKKGLIYSTKITLANTALSVEGKSMPISPGMSVNVEIKTGSRRVIEYLLSPLLQHQKEALHER